MVDAIMMHEKFQNLMKAKYPELCGTDTYGGFLLCGDNVYTFLKKYNIPSSEFKKNGSYDDVSYRDVWEYVCENEHLHAWWML